MRIGIDCTPLLGRKTGVGNYTDALLRSLADPVIDANDSIRATAFSLRGRGQLVDEVPATVSVRAAPVPARLLRAAWTRADFPPVELLCGGVDLFHATNFVLPPLRRARGVLTIHDLSFLHHASTVSADSLRYQQLVPRGLGRAAMVCTPSNAVSEQIQDAYDVPAARIAVTHLGVDAAWSLAKPLDADELALLGLPSTYLLAVGTLEPRKNLQFLVSAYRQLLDRGEDVPPLVLVGADGWGDRLDTSSLPAERIVRTGHVELSVLRRIVAGASLLAFPSLDEGFGLPPLEALACGVSVLSADLPVTREVLGDQAAYASPMSVDQFAEAMLTALRSPDSTPATRRAHAAGFSWQKCAEKTYAAYQRALA